MYEWSLIFYDKYDPAYDEKHAIYYVDVDTSSGKSLFTEPTPSFFEIDMNEALRKDMGIHTSYRIRVKLKGL
jgi:hypothetical protein